MPQPIKRVKVRYVIALFIILLSIFATPLSIECAYRQRGYEAIGGEYLFIPFGIILAMSVISMAADIEKAKNAIKKQAEHGGDHGQRLE